MKTYILLVCTLLAHSQIMSQDPSFDPSPHYPRLMVVESILGFAVKDNQRSKVIGGIGIWNYLPIKEFEGKRNSALGVSLPLQYQMVDADDYELLGYEHSFSVAVVARISKQQHPEKKALWFFLGVGPAIRTQWNSNRDAEYIPFIQQEVGLRVFKPTSLFPDTEFGFTVNWPLRGKEWRYRLHYATFFIRLAMFDEINHRVP